MLANRNLPYLSIFLKVCIKVSEKDRGITSFFHELRVQCTSVWAVYLYQT